MSEEDSKKIKKVKGTKRKRSKSTMDEAKAEETVPVAKKTKKAKKAEKKSSKKKSTKKANKDKPVEVESIVTGAEVKGKKQKRKRSKTTKTQEEVDTPAKKAKVQESDESSQDEQKPKQPMSSAEIIVKARELGISPAQMRLLAETSNSGINFDQYDDIPVTVSANGFVPLESFAECNMPEGLRKCIDMIGYKKPTPIQKYALPIILGGRDLMASAQTGSGKTAAFLFPIIAACMNEGARTGPSVVGRGREAQAYPLALVMAPTRELVVQIYNEAQKFTVFCKLNPVVVYGGVPYSGQARSVEMGCDLLIATPGRLKDMIDRGKISLSQVKFLCLDEADRMLDMGFEPQIREIVEKRDLPKQRGTVMFSATFPKSIRKLAADFLDRNHLTLTVGRVGSTTDSITQIIRLVSKGQKKRQLIDELKEIGDNGRILVFVETKRTCRALGEELGSNGMRALAIHGDCEQFQREAALRSFRKGTVNILVGTSVAARGLDIDNVTHVINFDLPDDVDDYVHRIGRTGRAGHTGTAIGFFDPNDDGRIAKHLLKVMEEAKQEVPAFLAQAALRRAKPSRRDSARNRGGPPGRRSVWGRPGKSFRSGGGGGGGGGGRRFGGGGGGGRGGGRGGGGGGGRRFGGR